MWHKYHTYMSNCQNTCFLGASPYHTSKKKKEGTSRQATPAYYPLPLEPSHPAATAAAAAAAAPYGGVADLIVEAEK